MIKLNSASALLPLVTAVCLVGVANTPAATFAPLEQELDAVIERAGSNVLDVRALPHITVSGKTYVQMDDMFLLVKEYDGIESAFGGLRWTNAFVYYQFDADVSSTNRQNWRNAAAEWRAVAPALNFVEDTGSGNYILIHNSTVNNSRIGMVGGAQDMNIVSWTSKFTISHEIGHALGLIHEHQRTDRDSSVQINQANVQPSFYSSNFPIYSGASSYGAYDFDSVMHYDKCAFSIDCLSGQGYCGCTHYTIVVLPPNNTLWQDAIGQRSHLSQLDATGMVQRYGGTPSPTPTAPPCGTVLSQNFDGVTAPALPAGWVATNIGGDGTQWVTSTTSSDTAPNDAFIPDQNGISDKFLDTPSIAISSASAQLNFRNNFNTEFDGITYWDGGVLEVSSPNINGGAFTDILAIGGNFISGGYTGIISNAANNPLANRMAWSGNSGGYINTVVNLGPNVNGQTIKLRFRFGTDEATSAPGWRIDTISVTGGSCGTPTPTPPPCGTTVTFTNSAPITIPDSGAAAPYPSNITVAGVTNPVTKVTLTLTGLTHTFPADVDILLVGPGGQNLIIMSDIGGGDDVTNVALTLDDAAATGLPASALTSGAYRPTNNGVGDTFPAPAPAPSGGTLLSVFNGVSPNGTWSLYVVDDAVADLGSFSGGWSLTITTAGAGCAPTTLGNISTRLRVLTGDNALIGGMIATGTAGKRVIIRAIGPSLTGFGVPGALANPTLDLFQGSTLLFSNDDWQNSVQQAEIAASGLAPSNAAESAIIWTLIPGQGYTATVRGKNGTTGVGVVEAYDLDQAAASKLGNISTRGFVSTGDDVMIGGLIIVGNTTANVIIRAIGPSLTNFGVPNALPDPTLELRDGNGAVLAFNDDWQTDQQALIIATGLAPAHIRESAIVRSLSPGPYTAIVREFNNFTGVALVEAYQLP